MQVHYADSEDEEDGVDDELYAQKMQQQLNSSRPRRAAAMQATAQMMVSSWLCLSLLFDVASTMISVLHHHVDTLATYMQQEIIVLSLLGHTWHSSSFKFPTAQSLIAYRFLPVVPAYAL